MSIPIPEQQTITNYKVDPNSESDYGRVVLWENQALTVSGLHWGASLGSIIPNNNSTLTPYYFPRAYEKGASGFVSYSVITTAYNTTNEIAIITGIGGMGSIPTLPEIPPRYTGWEEDVPPVKLPTSISFQHSGDPLKVQMWWDIYDANNSLIGTITGPKVDVLNGTEYVYTLDLDLSILPNDSGKTARRISGSIGVYTSDGLPPPVTTFYILRMSGLTIGVPHGIKFVDGNTVMEDPDFIVEWEGVEYESKSIVYGYKSNFLSELFPLSPYRSIKSNLTIDGIPSSRVIRVDNPYTSGLVENPSLAEILLVLGDLYGGTPTTTTTFITKILFDEDLTSIHLGVADLSLNLTPGDIFADFGEDPVVFSPDGRSLDDTHVLRSLSAAPYVFMVGPLGVGSSFYVNDLTIIDGTLTSAMDTPPFNGDTEPFEYLGETVRPLWDGEPHNSTSSFKYYAPYNPWDTTVTWHEPKQRAYSVGVDKGMVYIEGRGHSWSGLTLVTRNAPDGELNKRYLDGVLYDVRIPKHDFEGSIEAFTYPRDFERCIGQQQMDGESIRAHNQPAIPFHLVYRTGIGDGLPDSDEYKIHILYNCYAQDSGIDYNTINSSPEADTFKFDIYSIPVHTSGIKPSAYFTIDSRDINRVRLESIERVLYGADGSSPVLPDIEELRGFVRGDFG